MSQPCYMCSAPAFTILRSGIAICKYCYHTELDQNPDREFDLAPPTKPVVPVASTEFDLSDESFHDAFFQDVDPYDQPEPTEPPMGYALVDF